MFGPREIFDFLLDAVTRTHGILHLLFHPAHIDKPGVQGALTSAIRSARDAGLEWWRADEINAWERARRRVQWSAYKVSETTATIRLEAAQPLTGATLLWLVPDDVSVKIGLPEGAPNNGPELVKRWGFDFQAIAPQIHPREARRSYIMLWLIASEYNAALGALVLAVSPIVYACLCVLRDRMSDSRRSSR